MKQICKDLWQSKTFQPSSFLKTQSYFLETDSENILIYNTGDKSEVDHIANLGGINIQLLSHRHESGKNLEDLKQRFKSKLVCESVEGEFISKDCDIDFLVEGDSRLENGISTIVTPGHTSGDCCYYYESAAAGERYMFTGDLFFVDNNKLSTFVYSHDGGSNSELIKSLKKLSNFDPTLVLSSAFGGTDSSFRVNSEIWQKEIEKNIQNLSE